LHSLYTLDLKSEVCKPWPSITHDWSKKRKDWKFQKTRQTWLLLHMYDRDKVPNNYFPILLDYLGGLKGSARDTTIKKAEALMKELDECETQEELELQKVSRIREVLQLLS
uniref:Chromosome 7 open reading frame 50 n=1 Tax=Leptobrachium leishanense TaxID=445787 RepID=A0A8C5WE62_9ANUR